MESPTLQPGEIVFSENVVAHRYKALLEKLNTRHEQAMTDADLEAICRTAWERLEGSTPWDQAPRAARESFADDTRLILTAAADLMPIETLHGADGASVWLRGEG